MRERACLLPKALRLRKQSLQVNSLGNGSCEKEGAFSSLMTGICWENQRDAPGVGLARVRGLQGQNKQIAARLAPDLTSGSAFTLCFLVLGSDRRRSWEAHLTLNSSYSRVLSMLNGLPLLLGAIPGEKPFLATGKGKGPLWVRRALPSGSRGCRPSLRDPMV